MYACCPVYALSVESSLRHFFIALQDDIIKEALSKGVDLRHYSRQIQGELDSAEASCIGVCVCVCVCECVCVCVCACEM
jgi:hypothetical protein